MRLTHSAEEAAEVRREGRAAARAGASEHDNPYGRLTMAYHHWRDGFGFHDRTAPSRGLRVRVPGYSRAVSSTFVEG